MEEGISQQLEAGDAADPEFLAAVLWRLQLAKARARLREVHAGLLEAHLARLRAAPDTSVDVAAAMGWDREVRLPRVSVRVLLGCCARLREVHAGLLEAHLERLRAVPDTAVEVAAAMGWDREVRLPRVVVLGQGFSKRGLP